MKKGCLILENFAMFETMNIFLSKAKRKLGKATLQESVFS